MRVFKAMRLLLLALAASMVLGGTALARESARGIARFKIWLQPNPYGLDSKGEIKAKKVMRQGIDHIMQLKGALTPRSWHKLQTRAARIDGAAEAGVALQPIYRNGNVVGGTLALESVIGKGRRMALTIKRTESRGFKVSMDNGLGTRTVATTPAAAGSLRSTGSAPQPLDLY